MNEVCLLYRNVSSAGDVMRKFNNATPARNPHYAGVKLICEKIEYRPGYEYEYLSPDEKSTRSHSEPSILLLDDIPVNVPSVLLVNKKEEKLSSFIKATRK